MRVADTARRSSPSAATAAGDVTSGASTATKTRVRGIDFAGHAGTWDSTLPSAETHFASTLSCDETPAGRQEVTNLRLPGQCDERLLGSLGLQGPYHNWNRWYLPGLGRYLEPHPIAADGGFNVAGWRPPSCRITHHMQRPPLSTGVSSFAVHVDVVSLSRSASGSITGST